ncbi:MAG: acetyl-CoA carboxylase biotin carboxylase subunit [Dehalococcoidia bacterium]|nr:acetyl-CoA carboxylase biotin carboxylase subunit [Dehalococcoidia bacterium]
MINKILVANRGEIAIRIMRACREMGIKSVAVYSEVDEAALFVKYADEAYFIGKAKASESYLNIDKIIATALEAGAQAIHPGYGFLSENPTFCDACERAGIKFIGPTSKVLELMGNKPAARLEVQKAGVPVIPGSNEIVTNLQQAQRIAKQVGYPVIIKPAGGGGGIGMKVADNEDELDAAIVSAQQMAAKAFGVPDVYIERFIREPRHIEFQIMGDSFGNIVYLGERECSIQRRYQKLIEECPSVAITPEIRRRMGEVAVKVGQMVNYESAGTVEFIFSGGEFFFMEANTRVQVEHPVTEMVTGIDIVKEQIRIAQGEPLSFTQEDVKFNGWAIECRINAEDPAAGFTPSTGKLRGYRSPGGIGVRVDSGVHTRYTIPYVYDPMISKLIVWGRDRGEAIERMKRALYEYIIVGVETNIPFHKAVMQNPRFVSGEFSTHFIDSEKTLMEDMKRIMEQEEPLETKLSAIFDDSKRVAAIAAVMALTQQELPPVTSNES